MAWYRTGTIGVTINSNAVIGTGTAFIANSRVGDGFLGPDGRWYEVTNIASDTALSIAPNFLGATGTTGTFAIAPLQGYPKALADGFNALNNQFGATFAALGSSGTAAGIKVALGLNTTDGIAEGSINLYFTGARAIGAVLLGLDVTLITPITAADSLLVAAGKLQGQVSARLKLAGGSMAGPINEATAPTIASAATTDIGAATSNVIDISGTTTITSLGTIAAGARRSVRFTGALTLTYNPATILLPGAASIVTAAGDTADFRSLGAGAWVCLNFTRFSGKPVAYVFDRSNIVGTVSQVSGVPTGSVVETGSNASGQYVKLADGTLICTSLTNYPALSTPTAYGTAFTGPQAPALTYPYPFIAIPKSTQNFEFAGFNVWSSTVMAGNPLIGWGPVYPMSPVTSGSSTFNALIYRTAIGRWY
ncbi:hypothetical protein [Pseudomonas sp. NA-150]|uniref:hypothetical protein n=1 Tax=Pseudomonas sp. NA-150 TaxID=3367525 RepID=UPI0037C67FDD